MSRFIKLVAIVAAVAAAVLLVLFLRARSNDGPEPVDAAPLPARPAPIGTNGLSDADRATYYHLSEGGELYPLDWLLALEVEYPGTNGGPGLRRPFLANIERYGLLPDPKRPGNPYGLPVGVTFGRSHLSGQMMMGLNCTACHVGQVEYGAHAVRVDGGPSMGFINAFVVDMLTETQKTLVSPRRLTRFWSRVREFRAARRALGTAGEPDETPAPDEGWLSRLNELLTNNRGLLEGKVAALRNVPTLKAAAAVEYARRLRPDRRVWCRSQRVVRIDSVERHAIGCAGELSARLGNGTDRLAAMGREYELGHGAEHRPVIGCRCRIRSKYRQELGEHREPVEAGTVRVQTARAGVARCVSGDRPRQG